MNRCLACDSLCYGDYDYCAECEDAIGQVYVNDTQYVAWVQGLHPYRIPMDFIMVNYGFAVDTN